MKKFRFRLQKVLDVRRIRERQELERLRDSMRRKRQEEKRLDLLENEVKDLLHTMRQSQQTPFEAWSYAADARYRGRVEQAKTVRRQTRVLEKLRETRYESWRREASRQEDKMLDEVSVHAYTQGELAR
jgi:flagellar biosynthesis chaperone FliJ